MNQDQKPDTTLEHEVMRFIRLVIDRVEHGTPEPGELYALAHVIDAARRMEDT